MSAHPGHVLMSADAVGGVWTYALDLAGGLAAHGAATALAVLGPPPAADQEEAARAVPGLRLLPTDLPLDWLADAPEQVESAGAALAALAGAAQRAQRPAEGDRLVGAGQAGDPVRGVADQGVEGVVVGGAAGQPGGRPDREPACGEVVHPARLCRRPGLG